MLPSLALALTLLQQPPCQPGQVIAVDYLRDYTLDICGVGEIALRGVEPPLRVAIGFAGPNGPVSGELLGGKDIAPQAMEFLNTLLGKRVTFVYDGWRIGDSERRYAYVYLPDKSLLNAEIIRRGYGYADLQGSHPRRDEFIALEAVARRAKVGLWAS
jgi:endonuclease YncB( thermonuclease family)